MIHNITVHAQHPDNGNLLLLRLVNRNSEFRPDFPCPARLLVSSASRTRPIQRCIRQCLGLLGRQVLVPFLHGVHGVPEQLSLDGRVDVLGQVAALTSQITLHAAARIIADPDHFAHKFYAFCRLHMLGPVYSIFAAPA